VKPCRNLIKYIQYTHTCVARATLDEQFVVFWQSLLWYIPCRRFRSCSFCWK